MLSHKRQSNHDELQHIFVIDGTLNIRLIIELLNFAFKNNVLTSPFQGLPFHFLGK